MGSAAKDGVCIASMIIIPLGTIIFWLNRRRYPIADRMPTMGILTAIIIWILSFAEYMNTQAITSLGSTDSTEPCSLSLLTITTIIIPLGILTYCVRAWVLLFKVYCRTLFACLAGYMILFADRTFSLRFRSIIIV
jgi:hypothetical protein